MPRKSKTPVGAILELLPRKKKADMAPVHVTRGTDKTGRVVDYVRHELCKGKGCVQCNGYGFMKQYVLGV